MINKINLGILLGGRSAEHEISIISAKSIFNNIDRGKFDVTLIAIDKEGIWYHKKNNLIIKENSSSKLPSLDLKNSSRVTLIPVVNDVKLIDTKNGRIVKNLDIIFPVLHGTYGEDGTVQGFLKLLDIPFVGADVSGSAIGMDKDIAKRLLEHAGIPTAKFITLTRNNIKENPYEKISKKLGKTLFIKPANLGSSVGIHKIKNKKEFENAIRDAFLYDNKIIIEEAIKCREIECSVLGNEEPTASLAGEIIPTHEFYSYEAKYIDENGAKLKIPADLPKNKHDEVKKLAIQAYLALNCSGMARVDFFLKKNGTLLVNEINTIPGFTSISMYPKLWQASGIEYSELINKLIQHALNKYYQEKKLRTSFNLK